MKLRKLADPRIGKITDRVVIIASWDHESQRYWAYGGNFPGIAAEADSLEELYKKIPDVVRDILSDYPEIAKQYNGITVFCLRQDELDL